MTDDTGEPTATGGDRRCRRRHLDALDAVRAAGQPTSGRSCGCADGSPAAASTASTWPSSTCATTPGSSSAWSTARPTSAASTWWRSTGTVRRRPEGTDNPKLPTGEVEVGDCTVEVLAAGRAAAVRRWTTGSRSTRRCACDTATSTCGGPACRPTCGCGPRSTPPSGAAMDRQGFCEVETPLLWAPTPEGAREFAVPSRLHHGLLLRRCPRARSWPSSCSWSAGMDRYYQIARCLRDEDLRADRQFEFTQLDIEASFVGQEDVLGFVSEAVLDAAEAATGERPAADRAADLGRGHSTATAPTSPTCGSAWSWSTLGAVFAGTEVRAFARPVREGARASPRGASLEPVPARRPGRPGQGPRGQGAGLVQGAGGDGVAARLAARPVPHRRRAARACSRATGADAGRPGAGRGRRAPPGLRACSARCASSSGAGRWREGPYRYVWVVDFPMFDGARRRRATRSRPTTRSPCPTPTTSTCSRPTPLSVRSQAYDLVLNGWELGSGSVRIHRADVQRAGLRRARHLRRRGRAPLRVPPRRLPLRRPAPRRVRLRHRPAGGHLRRRGEHPRGHRLPQDPVGGRPADRGAQAAGARAPWPSWGSGCAGADATGVSGRRRPLRRRRRASGWPARRPSPPGSVPAPSTRSWASATWSRPGRRCGCWSRPTAWAR